MKPLALALALVSLGLGAAHGQAPVISGPAGTYTSTVTLAAPGPIPIAGTYTGPQGLYSFTLPAGGTIAVSDTGITITFGPAPAPPTPQPPAPPTTGPYFLVFVTDRASVQAPLTPAQAALSTSPTIGPALRSINPQNQWASPLDASAPTLSGWLPAIRAAGTPCILVLGTNAAGAGFRVETIVQPADEASVLAEVRRLAAGGLPR